MSIESTKPSEARRIGRDRALERIQALSPDERKRLLAKLMHDREGRGPRQEAPRLLRTSEELRVEAVAATRGESLARWLAEARARAPGGVYVADLALGAWEPSQVAHEFARQQGVRLRPPRFGTQVDGEDARDSARVVGGWIDDEAHGDGAVRVGLELASQLLGASGSPPTYLVLAPGHGWPWRTENEQLLRFLAQGLRHVEGRLLLVSTDGTPPPEIPGLTTEWTGRAEPATSDDAVRSGAPVDWAGLPGIVPGRLASRLGMSEGDALTLENGDRVVLPESRRAGAPALGDVVWRRGLVLPRWWAVYQRYREAVPGDTVSRAAYLSAAGWSALKAGSRDLALDLLARAVETADGAEERASSLLGLQTVRLLLTRYFEMSEAPDPPVQATPALRSNLHKLKAWGCVMSGRASEGLQRMEEGLAGDGFLEEGSVDLYLRNIYALMRFRNGDWEGALELEKGIEARLDSGAREVCHLRYVNCINQGRLYRAKGRLEEADRYFRRAFDVTNGVRIPNDAFYAQFCWSGLRASQNRPEHALQAMIRAALHWLANPVPEALAWRFAIAAVGEKNPLAPWTPERVSESLCARLLELASLCHPEGVAVAAEEVPEVAHAGRQPIAGSVGYGAPGWGVFLTSGRVQPPLRGPARDELVRTLVAILRLAHPGLPTGSSRTLVVDDGFGRDVPVDGGELLARALSGRAVAISYCGERVDLDGPGRAERLAAAIVGPGPGILDVDARGLVTFKRHLSAIELDASDRRLLAGARSKPTLAELGAKLGVGASRADLESLAARVRVLEARHVLALST